MMLAKSSLHMERMKSDETDFEIGTPGTVVVILVPNEVSKLIFKD